MRRGKKHNDKEGFSLARERGRREKHVIEKRERSTMK